jgi:hypothetical protein
MNRIKLLLLKFKARRLYYKLINEDADCGRNLLAYISSDYSKIQQEFDKTMLQIKKLSGE